MLYYLEFGLSMLQRVNLLKKNNCYKPIKLINLLGVIILQIRRKK